VVRRLVAEGATVLVGRPSVIFLDSSTDAYWPVNPRDWRTR
ncbi:MAG: hypothetical protein QOK30_2301, partial [Nocardioidaceae bacterium]|nr:hypothetical protein [Nocardioidaceae bacterium]